MRIEERMSELGLMIPEPLTLPPGLELPFPWVRVHGEYAYISGHGPQNADGSLAGPFGKVGEEVTPEQAYEAARLTGLAIIGSLKRALGDLDRVTAWLKILGLVNASPGFTQTPAVINGFTDLIITIWGPTAGSHARSAIGVSELPFGIPVEIEGQVEITTAR